MRSLLPVLLLFALCGALGAAAQDRGALPSFRSEATQHFPQQGGAALYHGICQGCHMPDAKGACGAGCYPALAGDVAVGVPGFAIRTVLNGLGAMPAFGQRLSDRQIADVINYIRTNFGNHYPGTVTAAQVRAARPSAAASGASHPSRGVHGFFW